MRRFLVEVVSVVLLGTVLVSGLAVWSMAPSAPRMIVDADEIPWLCYDERLHAMTTGTIRGASHLCYAESGIKAAIDAENLEPGEMYTAWLAYIDAPGTCSATPCPLPEMMRLNPPPPIMRFDGVVADDTRRATLSSVFRGLTPAAGTQIQLLLVGHGRAISGQGRPVQLLTAAWPGVVRDGPSGAGLIARAYFAVRTGWD
jgi:hypothetical protein